MIKRILVLLVISMATLFAQVDEDDTVYVSTITLICEANINGEKYEIYTATIDGIEFPTCFQLRLDDLNEEEVETLLRAITKYPEIILSINNEIMD